MNNSSIFPNDNSTINWTAFIDFRLRRVHAYPDGRFHSQPNFVIFIR
jgi:hypothetical protein